MSENGVTRKGGFREHNGGRYVFHVDWDFARADEEQLDVCITEILDMMQKHGFMVAEWKIAAGERPIFSVDPTDRINIGILGTSDPEHLAGEKNFQAIKEKFAGMLYWFYIFDIAYLDKAFGPRG